LSQLLQAPDLYRLVSFFETIPSRPIAQAWRNIGSPCSADRCSEKRSTGPTFLIAYDPTEYDLVTNGLSHEIALSQRVQLTIG
jgi:hypothetical protein